MKLFCVCINCLFCFFFSCDLIWRWLQIWPHFNSFCHELCVCFLFRLMLQTCACIEITVKVDFRWNEWSVWSVDTKRTSPRIAKHKKQTPTCTGVNMILLLFENKLKNSFWMVLTKCNVRVSFLQYKINGQLSVVISSRMVYFLVWKWCKSSWVDTCYAVNRYDKNKNWRNDCCCFLVKRLKKKMPFNVKASTRLRLCHSLTRSARGPIRLKVHLFMVAMWFLANEMGLPTECPSLQNFHFTDSHLFRTLSYNVGWNSPVYFIFNYTYFFCAAFAIVIIIIFFVNSGIIIVSSKYNTHTFLLRIIIIIVCRIHFYCSHFIHIKYIGRWYKMDPFCLA